MIAKRERHYSEKTPDIEARQADLPGLIPLTKQKRCD
jgi:hypothetical protein